MPFLLSLLPLGGLAGKLRSRQCKQHTNAVKAANITRKYTLKDFYQGNSFLSDWEFYTEPDPTNGYVNFQSREDAIQNNLAVVNNGKAIFSVDDITELPPGGMRNSIRITSPNTYSGGVFIADFEAMPYGCGVWPAFWSVGPNWPAGGEIDVVEGVNNQLNNQVTLHSGPDCSMPSTINKLASGNLISAHCPSGSGDDSGCAFLDSSSSSFGPGFNNANGGVFAHLWNNDRISMWRFPRTAIPKDISAKNPDPSQWGVPVASFTSANCDIPSHFFNHSLILDTTVCGDWAGSVYSSSGCPGTCADAVANPANFKNAKWEVNYIAVYQ